MADRKLINAALEATGSSYRAPEEEEASQSAPGGSSAMSDFQRDIYSAMDAPAGAAPEAPRADPRAEAAPEPHFLEREQYESESPAPAKETAVSFAPSHDEDDEPKGFRSEDILGLTDVPEPREPPPAKSTAEPKPFGPPAAEPVESVEPTTVASEPLSSEAPPADDAPYSIYTREAYPNTGSARGVESASSEPPPAESLSSEPTSSASPAPRAPRAERPAPAPSRASEPSAPAATPSPAPSPTRGTGDGVEDLPFNPSAGTRQLRAESSAGKNRTLDLANEKGEIASAEGDALRALGDARSAASEKDISARRESDAQRKMRYEDTRLQLDRETEALKQKMGAPPFDTVGLVMGLVSAFAASQGKNGLAAAFQAIGPAINTRMKRYHGEIEGGKARTEGLGKLVNMDRLAAADDLEAANALSKAVGVEFIAAAEQIKTQAKTEEERNAADQTVNALKQQMVNAELDRRQKAAIQAQRRKLAGAIGRATTQEQRQAIADANGEVGQAVYRDFLKTNKSVAETTGSYLENEQKVANTDLARAKAEKERLPPGPGKVTEVQAKARALYDGAAADRSRIEAALKNGATPGYLGPRAASSSLVPDKLVPDGDSEIFRSARAIVNDVLRDESGAAIGQIERDELINPLLSTDANVRRQAYLRILSKMEAMKGKAGASAGGPPGASGKVRVVGPDGNRMELGADAARVLMDSHGYSEEE